MLALIGGAAALAAAVWLWGGLAGLLFGARLAARRAPGSCRRSWCACRPGWQQPGRARGRRGARALLPGAARVLRRAHGAGGVSRPC